MQPFQKILRSSDSEAAEIIAQHAAGEELGAGEIEKLFQGELHLVCSYADYLRERQVGDYASFVINRQINYTNTCISKCSFCAFYREKGYTMSIDDIVARAKEAVEQGATELHIVGAHNPEIPFEYYEEVLRTLKLLFPNITLKAFTATEIAFFARNFGMSIEEVLSRLKQAGLDYMPGGGAEILSERIRKKICPGKASAQEWLNVMRTAHSLGIKTNATMLFGHIESYRDRAEHLLKLKELQEETHGFLSFIPLVYHPANNPLGKVVKHKTSGVDILKTIAISRIVLGDSFRNIRAYWIMLGKKLAQVALRCGANDIDGTVIEEKVAHEAGAESETRASVSELVAIIKGAGLIPVQRSTDYKIIRKW